MDLMKKSLEMHEHFGGKMEIRSKVPVQDKYDLSLAYSPGVAAPCLEIEKNRSLVYDYTMKGNLVAIVTDGTAEVGLGEIGPEAALPVMEGKAVLFQQLGDVSALPLCIKTQVEEEIIEIVLLLQNSFSGVNLEDIKAPRCFAVEDKLIEKANIPIFHDDQHGTAML